MERCCDRHEVHAVSQMHVSRLRQPDRVCLRSQGTRMRTNSLVDCGDCGVRPGENHLPGCDLETCPFCGGQLISCYWRCLLLMQASCEGITSVTIPWSGVFPGVVECQEFGWYAKLVSGKGWVACAPDEPGAMEDLNRLRVEASWDMAAKRWVKP